MYTVICYVRVVSLFYWFSNLLKSTHEKLLCYCLKEEKNIQHFFIYSLMEIPNVNVCMNITVYIKVSTNSLFLFT